MIAKNDLTRFTYALKDRKKLDRIIWQNIFFSMFIVALLIVLEFARQNGMVGLNYAFALSLMVSLITSQII